MTASRVALVLVLGVWAAPAFGQDTALSQTLFDDAVKLMEQKRFAEACPKLVESQRLDPGGGTLLNIGFCRENEGKLASAWAAYNEALSRAIQDGRKEREETARVHIDDLEGRVARLAIDVSEDARRIPDLEIHLDGTPVRQAAWGVLAPVDRGVHGIVVTAPGKRELRKDVMVEADGAVQRVAIPALEAAPARNVSTTEVRNSSQVVAGVITLGVGVAAVGVGIVTGAFALSLHQQSNGQCTFPGGTCSQQGYDFNQQSQTLAWTSDFGFGVGVAAVAAGILLVVTAPKGHSVASPSARARLGLSF